MRLVTAALAGKRFRASIGGEWKVASSIVCRMVRAPKCRAADDLLLAAESHPAFGQARLDFASRATDDLIRVVTGASPLPIRALALWYAIGTNRRPSLHLQSRRGDPTAVFNGLRDAGVAGPVVETAREGFRKTSEVLAPFVALLYPLWQTQTDAIDVGDIEYVRQGIVLQGRRAGRAAGAGQAGRRAQGQAGRLRTRGTGVDRRKRWSAP